MVKSPFNNAGDAPNVQPPPSEKKTRWMSQFLNLTLSKDNHNHHHHNNNNNENKNNSNNEQKKDEALPWGGCGPNQNQPPENDQHQRIGEEDVNAHVHTPVPTSIEFDPTLDTHTKLSQRHSDISDSYMKQKQNPSAPVPASMSTPPQPIGGRKKAAKTTKNAKKIDEYGFIVNMDDKGQVRDELSVDMKGGAATPSANSNANQYHDNNNYNSDEGERREEKTGLKQHLHLNRLKKDKDNHTPKKTHKKHIGHKNSNSSHRKKRLSKEEKQQKRLRRRREKKWLHMLHNWEKDFPHGIHQRKKSKSSNTRASSSSGGNGSATGSGKVTGKPPNGPKRNKLRQRVRKGIPNSCRGEAWTRLAGIKFKMEHSHVGVYAKLVARTCEISKPNNGTGTGTEEEEFNANLNVNSNYNSFNGDEALNPNPNAELNVDHAVMSETIERDLQRTFPRHSMFYDSYSEEDYDSSDDEEMGMDIGMDTMMEGELGGSGEGVDSYDSEDGEDASFELEDRKVHMAVDSSNSNSGSQSLLESINSQEHGNCHADGQTDQGQGGITMSYSNEEEEDELELILNGSRSKDYTAANTKHRSNLSDGIILDDAPPTPSTSTGMGDACWNVACPAPPSFGKKGDAFTPTSASTSQNQKDVSNSSPEQAHDHEVGAKKTATGTMTQRSNKKNAKKIVDFTSAEGGQASLRRVLRAYSIYDQDVGYCQGMNFIAGMFITFVSEEEAFWLLVHVMTESPCRMRGLFGEGMSEAHQVLYVAEQLISQFHPRLARHFEKENIHITMFATQWLLTMYTSSFPFDMVTRVWDAFLSEGWKVTYRVMLALLEKAQPILMKMQFEDILNYFKELPFEIDSNDLMESAFKIPLKKKHIGKYAKEWLVKEELKKQQKEKEKE